MNASIRLKIDKAKKINIFSIIAPSLRCLPERDNGIPISRDILALKAEIPKKRLQENPPLFIVSYSLTGFDYATCAMSSPI